jgi:uncharacterized membrane protein
MRNIFGSTAAIIGGLILSVVATQAAASKLQACNHTGKAVLVASSYIPVGGSLWRNKGWTVVSAGACKELFTTENNTVYLRAEVKGDSSQFWGSDIDQCVDYPGPYDFTTRSEDTTCPQGQPAKFTTIHTGGKAIFTWNLNP